MTKTRPAKNNRRLISWLWIFFLKVSGLLAWAQREICSSSGIVVLTLHRVLPDPAFQEANSPEGMVLRRKTFEALLSFLTRNCEITGLRGGFPEPDGNSVRPRIAITFDDGWKDTATVVYPLAVNYGTPFTVFVCSGIAGQSSPFWPELVTRLWQKSAEMESQAESFSRICQSAFPHYRFVPGNAGHLNDLIMCLKTVPAAKRDELVQALCAPFEEDSSEVSELESTMTWQETKAMDRSLCSIGSHTQSHEILTRLPMDRARQELEESKKQIQEQLGHECTMFSYTDGAWSNEVRDLVELVGYKQAFINSPGVWTRETNAWLIPRVNIWEGSITNRAGEFSATMFQYSVLWRAYRANNRK
jgi:peptidoglycan/xylan/chitin deacetylase (PgdA/CDA1 family)